MRIAHLALVTALALAQACDDGNGARAGRTAPSDAAVDAAGHGAPPDGAPGRGDGSVADAAAKADGGRRRLPVDAWTLPDIRTPDVHLPPPPPHDAAVLDAARDAVVADVRTPDAAAPPPCVGIEIPPVPDSPDGTEVCNYRDDDGDALVDEGFQYEYLDRPIRIVAEPQYDPLDYQVAWAGDGFGVSWNNGAMHFVKVDEHGCPASPHRIVDQNPDDPGAFVFPGSGTMRFAGDRFAMAFTQARRAGTPGAGVFSTFVQLFDRSGSPIGEPFVLDPSVANSGSNAIAAMGDDFGVFAMAFDPQTGFATISTFVVLNQNGVVIAGPVDTFSRRESAGVNMAIPIGMEFDGEGFGFAWYSSSFGDGIYLMRWAPDGSILLPATRVGNGVGDRVGIGWSSGQFAVPFGDRTNGLLALTAKDGNTRTVLVGEPVPPRVAGTVLGIVNESAGWTIAGGWQVAEPIVRLDADADSIAPSTFWRGDVLQIGRQPGGPIAVVTGEGAGVAGEWNLSFSLVGCSER